MRRYILVLAALAVMAVTGILTACGDRSVTGVSLDKTSLELTVGDSYRLVAAVTPADAQNKEVAWSSDAALVAAVDDRGNVTALSEGSAVITAQAGGRYAQCQVTVGGDMEIVDDERRVNGYLYHETFDERTEVPAHLRKNISGGGALGVQNGELRLYTLGTGEAFANKIFDEALSGKVIAQTRVKVGSTSFSNVLFFYKGTAAADTGDIIACLGMDGGSFKNHNGTAWSSPIAGYSVNTWYEITMALDIGNSQYDLIINGTRYSGLPFRNKGDGIEDNIRVLNFGTAKADANMFYDYIKVFAVNEDISFALNSPLTQSINLDDPSEDPFYVFDYTAAGDPEPTVSITCDRTSGFAFDPSDGKKVIFTGAGVYTFTVTATNGVTDLTETVTVTVTGSAQAPALSIGSAAGTIALSVTDTYVLDYELTSGNPAPNIDVTCDKALGYTLDADKKTVTFTTAGIYVFTVTASNKIDTVSGQITVKVMASHAIFEEDFDSGMPSSLENTVSGSGAIAVKTDGSAGVLNIKTGAGTGNAMSKHDFGFALSGKVLFETTFKNDSSASGYFGNILFLYQTGAGSGDTSKIAAALAVEAGALKHHDGSWKTITPLTIGNWYEIDALVDFDAAQLTVYVNGTKFGPYNFRNSSIKDDVSLLYIGSSKVNTDFSYDSIKATIVQPPTLGIDTAHESLDLDLSNSLVLDYRVLSMFGDDYDIEISCDRADGFEIGLDHKTVSFTTLGTYVFTLTVSDRGGIAAGTITVEVSGTAVAPSVEINSEKDAQASELAAWYALAYTVTGSPVPSVELTCDRADGWQYEAHRKLISFDQAGVYIFTLNAENYAGTDSETLKVTVTFFENADRTAVYTQDYAGTEAPANVTVSGPGSIDFSEDGQARIATTGSEVYLDHSFSSRLSSGVVIFDMRVKDDSTASNSFANLFFLYDGSITNGNISVCYAIDAGKLRYHNGASWVLAKYNDADVVFARDTWHDIRIIVDFDDGCSSIYFDGRYINTYAFRNAGKGAATLRSGVGNGRSGTDFVFDYMYVNNVSPVLLINESAKSLGLGNDTVSYALDYAYSGTLLVECDQESGFVLDPNNTDIEFSAPGTYVFTITVSNTLLVVNGTVTVTIAAPAAPTIEVTSEKDAELDEFSPVYTLAYDVSGVPTPEVTLVCDDGQGTPITDGWAYNELTKKISFTAGGVYRFTVTADTGYGRDSDTFTVTVRFIEAGDKEEILSHDFAGTTAPAGIGQGATGAGQIDFSVEGEMTVSGGAAASNAYVDFLLDNVPSGMTVTEMTFQYLGGTLRLYYTCKDNVASGGNISACVIVYVDSALGKPVLGVNNKNNGAGSQRLNDKAGNAVDVVVGTVYTIRIVADYDGKMSHVFFGEAEGDIRYINAYEFRNGNVAINRIRTYIDAANSGFTLYRFEVYRLTPWLDIAESAYTIGDFDGAGAVYELEYTASGNAENVTVSCDRESGFTLDADNKSLTFTAAGVYTFTVTVENYWGTVGKTITVTVE
jgi:PKD repeat protein